MKILTPTQILQYLKGITARMEVDEGLLNVAYPIEDIKRDLLQLLEEL